MRSPPLFSPSGTVSSSSLAIKMERQNIEAEGEEEHEVEGAD
jgi:hypothetical protein